MYVVECSVVCLSTDMYQHIKLELFDCCVLVFHRRRKCVSPKKCSPFLSFLGASKGQVGDSNKKMQCAFKTSDIQINTIFCGITSIVCKK